MSCWQHNFFRMEDDDLNDDFSCKRWAFPSFINWLEQSWHKGETDKTKARRKKIVKSIPLLQTSEPSMTWDNEWIMSERALSFNEIEKAPHLSIEPSINSYSYESSMQKPFVMRTENGVWKLLKPLQQLFPFHPRIIVCWNFSFQPTKRSRESRKLLTLESRRHFLQVLSWRLRLTVNRDSRWGSRVVRIYSKKLHYNALIIHAPQRRFS